MKPGEFETIAGRLWAEIPDRLRQGVEAVEVDEKVVGHPSLPGVYTLGECLTERWPGAYADAGDTRSRLVLHHGSFAELAALDPAFDWELELSETLLHELLHHREAAAGERGLEAQDRAEEENRRRHAGLPFDPVFYRAVPSDADGSVRLDSEIFVEARGGGSDSEARFTWRGHEYGLRVPRGDGAAFVQVPNLARGRLWVVVRPRRSWWARILGRPEAPPRQLKIRALPARRAG
ncbi:MAG: hypothetical protein ACE5HQ_11735 [Gemmatimonadota bacterium]